MPELLEVEVYRRLAARTVGRRIRAIEVRDPHYWHGDVPPGSFVGAQIRAARRIGKLLVLDTTTESLGLRFGMTGRLLVDGEMSIDRLEYSGARDLADWHRFALRFDGDANLVVTDPRRLGWVEGDPDESRLGPDAAVVGLAALRTVLAASRAPLKARLMDQGRLAGLGNLLTDEILWRAGLDPRRAAGGLSTTEMRRLHRHLRTTLDELGERGGSHTGDLQPARRPGALCPRDGEPVRRDTTGGRTTWWCPAHQT